MLKNIILALVLFCGYTSSSQWQKVNTLIDDNLTGVAILDKNGIVSGKKGLYYTISQDTNTQAWNRFEITDNDVDKRIYEHTNFSHCTAAERQSTEEKYVYACGKDTLSNKAIIFRIGLPSLNYKIVFTGEQNSTLHKIRFNNSNNKYYAVGDSGLLVTIVDTTATVLNTSVEDNFNSIDFCLRRLLIGANEKLFTGDDRNNTSINFQVIKTPSANHVDVHCGGNEYSVGNNYIQFSQNQPYYLNNFDYGELNATTIIENKRVFFVGTDHGIFKSTGSRGVLEWQPSSERYSINDIWVDPTDFITMYACGKNGTLLKTDNLGGKVKPFLRIAAVGKCYNESVNFNLLNGSSNECLWYANGVQFHEGCRSFTKSLPEIGAYEISVIGKNTDSLETSASQNIQMVDIPEINKLVTIGDTILCKGEPIGIQIEDSESYITYTLRGNNGNDVFGTSPVGNGDIISFQSKSLSETGSYYLTAKDTRADCRRRFTEQFDIIVEQTKASFNAQLLNVEQDSFLTFYETTTDASNFKWAFSPSASPSTSEDRKPRVSFSELGSTEITLETWSDNGCYDTISTSGPYVYKLPEQREDCWTMVNTGEGFLMRSYESELRELVPTKDGFLTCGYYTEHLLNSKFGQIATIKDDGIDGGIGYYLAKYDKEGVIKWTARTVADPSRRNSSVSSEIFSIAVDSQGDIYVCGKATGFFIDNTDNTIDLYRPNERNSGFIMKLTADGERVWHVQSRFFSPRKLYIDKNDDLICQGFIERNFFYTNEIYFNETLVDTLENVNTDYNDIDHQIIKFSPDGKRIWDTTIGTNKFNDVPIVDMGFDINNSLYITGTFENQAHFYSVGETTPEMLNRPTSFGNNTSTQNLFLVKYDEKGRVQWKIKGYTEEDERLGLAGITYSEMYPKAIKVTDEGDCYITGNNRCDISTKNCVVESTFGRATKESIGTFYVTKIDSNGICKWIRGAANSGEGTGLAIITNEEEITVLSSINTYSPNGVPLVVKLTTSEDQTHRLLANRDDYLMMTYDTLGNLQRVLISGENQGPKFYIRNTVGFFKNDEGFFYLGRNLGFFGGVESYDNYGHPVELHVGEPEGLITRFNENCNIIQNYSIVMLSNVLKLLNIKTDNLK